MSVYIVPYKMGSQTAKDISKTLGVMRKRSERIRFGDVIINWGSTSFSKESLERANIILNRPEYVASAIDKSKFLYLMAANGLPIPDIATNIRDARSLFSGPGSVVYCRTLKKSSQGKGIVIATNPDELVEAPLYTKGIECKREYRVHVVDGNVVDLVAKVKLNKQNEKYVEPSELVRNMENGYVFARNAVKIPDRIEESLRSLAVMAIKACRLNFGAVDIIRSTKDNLYVLEVNTAPGCSGTTLESYVRYFAKILSSYVARNTKPEKVSPQMRYAAVPIPGRIRGAEAVANDWVHVHLEEEEDE